MKHFRLVSALTAMLLLSALTGSISMVSAENLAFSVVGSAEGSFFFWAGLTLLFTALGFLGAGIMKLRWERRKVNLLFLEENGEDA